MFSIVLNLVGSLFHFYVAHRLYRLGPVRTRVPATTDTFDARADLPASWAGLRDADLAAVTGVPDAKFCHNGRFIAAAKSYEGIRQLARLALQDVAQAVAAE